MVRYSFWHCLISIHSYLQGGTYAGNAVSCAAAIAVADVIKSENILDNVNAR
jgi:4-aminobutyrate aminotransferase-like enzyme